MLEDDLEQYLLTKYSIQPNRSDKKYKMKFQMKHTHNALDAEGKKLEEEYVNDICMKIFKVEEEKYCVEFTMLSGDK